MAQLLTADFSRGWENYAAREFPGPAGIPRWDGSPLAGRRILLLAEQGLGDTVQFIRYAALLKDLGGSVWSAAPMSLVRLLETFPALVGVTPENNPPECDWYASVLDLPRLFGTVPDTIPGQAPYLAADPDQVRWWKSALRSGQPRLKVGIAWKGSPQHHNDRRRSIEPAQLAALSSVPNADFVSLQKGQEHGHEAAALSWSPLPRPLTDFADTAALMMSLDLVVSVDTAVAHVAGALARPVWTLLPFAPDWRWMMGREDTPWYPSMRLFRQPRPNDWQAVMARVRAELEALASSPY